ncbi:hypothetical protein CL617_02430 [archaeon]|nr:hypothetical protein [archaeon]|tara:strand:- start:817 stop:4116 length:3300 start_codon:yes stop_codon:yes gene_type:complete
MGKFNYISILVALLLLETVNAQSTINVFGTELSIIVAFPLAIMALSLFIFLLIFVKDTIQDYSSSKKEPKEDTAGETPIHKEIKVKEEKKELKEEDTNKKISTLIGQFRIRINKLNAAESLEDFSRIYKEYLALSYNLKSELTYDELTNRAQKPLERKMIKDISLFKYSGRSYNKKSVLALLEKLKTLEVSRQKELKSQEKDKISEHIIDPIKSLLRLKPKLAQEKKYLKPTHFKEILHNLKYKKERKEIENLISSGKDVLKINPLKAKRLYSQALSKYYKIPSQEERNLTSSLYKFYQDIELFTGKRHITSITKKIFKLKLRERIATPKGAHYLKHLGKGILNEEQKVKDTIVHTFKKVRKYEDKFIHSISDYIIKKERKGVAFIREEEESLMNSIYSTLKSIKDTRRQTLHYTKKEFNNLTDAIEKLVLGTKNLEKKSVHSLKREEQSIINAIGSFFSYIKSEEWKVISSIEICEKEFLTKEKEELHNDAEFLGDIRKYELNLVKGFTDYIKNKEERGLRFLSNTERKFISKLKIFSLNTHKRRTVEPHKTEFSKLHKHVKASLIDLKQFEKANVDFITQKEKNLINSLKNFFNHIKSNEKRILSSIKRFKKSAESIIPDKEDFNKANYEFKRKIAKKVALVEDLKDYVGDCEKENYLQIRENDIIFHNNIQNYLNTIKRKQELGINYIHSLEKSFVNEVKIHLNRRLLEKRKRKLELLERIPSIVKRKGIPLRPDEKSILDYLQYERDDVRNNLIASKQGRKHLSGILSKVKESLQKDMQDKWNLQKEEERYVFDAIRESNEKLEIKEKKILQSIETATKNKIEAKKHKKNISKVLEDYLLEKEKEIVGFVKEEEMDLIHGVKSFLFNVKNKATIASLKGHLITKATRKSAIKTKDILKSKLVIELNYLLKTTKKANKFFKSLERFVKRQENKIKNFSKIEKDFIKDLRLLVDFFKSIGGNVIDEQHHLVESLKAHIKNLSQKQTKALKLLSDYERESMSLLLKERHPHIKEHLKESKYLKLLSREEKKIKSKIHNLKKQYHDLTKVQHSEATQLTPTEKQQQIKYPKHRISKEKSKLLQAEKQIREKLTNLVKFN